MNGKASLVLVSVALCAAVSAMGVEKVKKESGSGRVTLPAGVRLIEKAVFKTVVPRLRPEAVPAVQRLPFTCQQGGYDYYHKPRIIVVYKGANPIPVPKLRIHWELQYCCDATVAAPSDNYMLYTNQGFYVYDGVPPNLNWPPSHLPPLNCTAYGWIEE
ncbi:MAG: hypothetical protein ACOY3Y_00350 [Acidobacteriota bacterium]